MTTYKRIPILDSEMANIDEGSGDAIGEAAAAFVRGVRGKGTQSGTE